MEKKENIRKRKKRRKKNNRKKKLQFGSIFFQHHLEKDTNQTCFCQPSRMSHFGELPDVVYQKLLKEFKKKPKITTI